MSHGHGFRRCHTLIDSSAGVTVVSEDEAAGTCILNFAVRSRHATAVSLVLARHNSEHAEGPKGSLEVALDSYVHRTGDMWHVALEGLKDVGSLCYGWRVDGDTGWGGFHSGTD